MLRELAKDLGIEVTEDMSDEDIKQLINDKIAEKDTQISNLESEKDTLSKANEELTTSVEGYKSSEEKLTLELSETKTKLTTTEAKLEQVTELYKEHFTQDSDKQEIITKSEKELKDDVLQQILDTK